MTPPRRAAAAPGGRSVRISLAALAVVLFLWGRSHRRADVAAFFTPAGKLQAVASHRGQVLVFLSDLPFRQGRGLSADFEALPAAAMDEVRLLLDSGLPRPRRRLGFEFSVSPPGAAGMAGRSFTLLAVPYWFLAALGLIAPARSWRRRRRARAWMRAGLCPECGYNLRGGTATGSGTGAVQYPECGWAMGG